VVEVKYQSVLTSGRDHSLRFGEAIRERPDKTVEETNAPMVVRP